MIYLDLFSINHVIIGFLIGGIFAFMVLAFWKSFFSSFILMLFWEIYEQIKGVGETYFNSSIDLILGIIFFCCGYIIFAKLKKYSFKFTRHKNFFDAWSLVHLGIWAIIASILSILSVKLALSFFPCFLVMILYEYYEKIRGIGEAFINSFGDIIFNLIGFFGVYLVNGYLSMDNKIGIILNSSIFVVFLISGGHYYKNNAAKI